MRTQNFINEFLAILSIICATLAFLVFFNIILINVNFINIEVLASLSVLFGTIYTFLLRK